MSCWLLKGKDIMVREFYCMSLANCGLKNSVTALFNSMKHYKQYFLNFAKSLFFVTSTLFTPCSQLSALQL